MMRFRQLSPGTALAMIALFVALTGTATAGGIALIVTSANIKNGTIRTVDLSTGAKRALKVSAARWARPAPQVSRVLRGSLVLQGRGAWRT
jgi:hypothetical protein